METRFYELGSPCKDTRNGTTERGYPTFRFDLCKGGNNRVQGPPTKGGQGDTVVLLVDNAWPRQCCFEIRTDLEPNHMVQLELVQVVAY
ncbi:unnamed protein product [Lupinus luteus]|uniref:Uncharacterized protein n=1 Tax=Lupinus luteus TaxID=3873 RepID=A0AAV1WGE0_LUPLU